MTNSLTFIKNNNSAILENLNDLAADLNTSGLEINYYFFVLDAVSKKHHSTEVKKEAKIYLSKKQNIQDDLDYLNSCISFLERHLIASDNSSSLSQAEITERILGLTEDIKVFIERNQSIQRACFRFTKAYFHTPYGQSNMAA